MSSALPLGVAVTNINGNRKTSEVGLGRWKKEASSRNVEAENDFLVIAMGSHWFLVCAILSCYSLLRLQRRRGHAK